MATAHVTGLAATLMDHYPEFQLNPALMRAHLMATAIAHDGVTGKSNDYGLGRVSGYLAHWDTSQFRRLVHALVLRTRELPRVSVPGHHGAARHPRLVVVMTWDEPPASAGASQAVTLRPGPVDHPNGDCSEPERAVRRLSRPCPAWTTSSTSSSTTRRPACIG